MKVEMLNNPGTPTRLAKQIRVITKRIIECELSLNFVPANDAEKLKLTEAQSKELETYLDGLLMKRTYLIESLIGYLANDDFNKQYLTFTKRTNIPPSVSASVRKNIKLCQQAYAEKVKNSIRTIKNV